MNNPEHSGRRDDCPVAIIGMGCLFPNAANLTDYWRSIRQGQDGITETPSTHWSVGDYVDPDPRAPDMTYCGRGGFLSPVAFDPTEFGIPPSILEATDTSQLLGLVVAKAALEDAGYGEGRDFNRERVSVILGVTGTQELVLPLSARLGHPLWRKALREAGVQPDVADVVVKRIADGYVSWQENSFPGLLGNVVAGRIANRLNLRGTNCVVDAACASSLGAVYLAALELAAGRCDMALTGGADALNDIFMYMCFSKTPALSPTGDARPFSDDADGTVLGEGIGMLTLKRLADAERDGDRIYAVLRGIGTSSDGRSQSIYAPHAAGQAGALRSAYRLAGFGPETVELIEAHGTGTKVGDAAEFEALRTVFREARSDGQWCALGSVKSQVGHTKAAAGAAGLIKAALAVYHRCLPPTIKVKRPNAKLEIEESPFYLSTALRPWIARDGRPRRAGVSSFGFGGSNFHVVIEEHRATLPAVAWDGSVDILAISADSLAELDRQLEGWIASIGDRRLGDATLAHEAAQTRRSFSVSHTHRLVAVIDAETDVARLLQQAKGKLAEPVKDLGWTLPGVSYGRGRPTGKMVFLFPGQGSQYVGMGRGLACTFPEMVRTLAEADAAAKAGIEVEASRLSDLVYPRPVYSDETRERQTAALTRTEVAQPAIGAVSLGMARVLQRFGIVPDLVAGHSYGELVALCCAGRIDVETFHRLSRLRGRLMAEGEEDRGTMLAVKAPLDELATLVEEQGLDVVIANRNAPMQGVLSGNREAIQQAAQACQARGYATRGLPVSGAFHSPLMEQAFGPFRQALEAVAFEPGSIGVFANTTAVAYAEDADVARSQLAEQLIRPVDFVQEIENLHDAGARTFVEVGPKGVLTGLVRSILADRPHETVAFDPSGGRTSELADLGRVLARLAALGHPIDLTAWGWPPKEPRKPKMVVPLVGANLRPPNAAGGTGEPPRTPAQPRRVPESRHIEDAQPADARDVNQAKDHATPDRTREPLTAGQPPAVMSKPDPARSALLGDALRTVQESLQAMRTMQQQTAEAHRRFLELQEQSQKTYMDLVAGQQQMLERSVGLRPAESSAEPIRPAKSAPVLPFASDLPAGPMEQSLGSTDATSAPPAAPAREPATQPVAPTPPAPEDGAKEAVVLDVVSEKTGYPREMLDLDMDIESDLGIDSIKRVEIIAGIEERLPDWTGVSPEHMGGIRTLRQIMAFLDSGAAAAPAESAKGGDAPPNDAVPTAARSEAGAVPAAAVEGFAETLLAVVSELTGYPSDMLDIDMDLEVDLGIDSIKRVEILAAVEARLPDVPPASPETMGGLRTLRQIVEQLGDGPVPASPDKDATLEPAKARQDPVETQCATAHAPAVPVGPCLAPAVKSSPPVHGTLRRSVIMPAELPPLVEGGLNVPAGREVWVTDDGADLARAIVAELQAAGCSARLVAPLVTDAPCEQGKSAWHFQRPPGTSAGGLICVAPPVEAAGMVWDLRAEALLEAAFAATQSVAEDLGEAAAEGGALLATVARMDGAFGLRGGGHDPTQGGLAGLAKTAALEWPNVSCRAIDVALSWHDAAASARAVVQELSGDGPVEVGLDEHGRSGLDLVEDPASSATATPALAAGDVVVISGGARGVTAECANALAERCRPTLVLLGRSQRPDEEPGWLAGLEDASSVKQAILHNSFADSSKVSPPELQAAYDRLSADREIRRNLARLEAAGAQVIYRSVDIRNAADVRTVLDEVRTTLGPIRGLVHAAGALADRRIEEKTPEQFARVMDTKVAGLRNLLEAIRLEELRRVALFSSVSGRFGNPGQADYAMANEVLNKVAHRLCAELPSCRVVSMVWGPWDGGMVTPSLRRRFLEQGVALLPIEAGARCFVEEFLSPRGGATEVILQASASEDPDAHRPQGLPCQTEGQGPFAFAFERRLDVESHPFLRSHVLDGHPVLPAAIMLEWLAHAAAHKNPGLLLHGLNDLRVLKGVVLREDSENIRLFTAPARRQGSLFEVDVELRADTPIGSEAVHARATVLLSPSLPEPQSQCSPRLQSTVPYERGVDRAYSEVLFHGEHFRAIEVVDGVSPHGLTARVQSAPEPGAWMTAPLRSHWLADPLVLDAGFQMLILWCYEELGAVSLPTFISRYRQYRQAFPSKGVQAVLEVRDHARHSVTGDITFMDRDGTTVARIEGCEHTVDASLTAAFKRGRGFVAGAAG